MFTGIVQGLGQLVEVREREGFRSHRVAFPPDLTEGLVTGASVANNGCCLTVTAVDGDLVSFDLIDETLRLTNLGRLRVGDEVNLERAARVGDEIGGHMMSGHIVTTGRVVDLRRDAQNCALRIELPSEWMRYVLPKGFIGVDGVSLTIGAVSDQSFELHLIPETLQRTLFGSRQVGDRVNIEVDPQTQAIVDTVERLLAGRVLLDMAGLGAA